MLWKRKWQSAFFFLAGVLCHPLPCYSRLVAQRCKGPASPFMISSPASPVVQDDDDTLQSTDTRGSIFIGCL